MMMQDLDLLRQYSEKHSETAFAELVTRHLNLVYSVAFRQTRDRHLAEEVTQTVFVILARKAGSLSSKTILAGWLCQTARYASAKALTSQRRRQTREHQAYMDNTNTDSAETAFWTEMAPVLDSALGELGRKDHDALVIRFLQGRSFKDTAEALGTTEPAAKMRVNRALEKLRAAFARRGVQVTVVIIAAALSTNAVEAAPPGLAASVIAVAASGAQAAPSTLSLIKATIKFMAWKKATTGAALGIALLAAGTGTYVLQQKHARADDTAPPRQAEPAAPYATPEATFNSMLAALSSADPKKFAETCTPERAQRFLAMNGQKSAEQIKAEAAQKMKEFANYTIVSKDQISADEVHLRIRVNQQPVPGRPGPHETVFRLRKVGDDWKFDGNVP